MTLTTDDLQAIGNLIDQKLEEKLAPIKAEQQKQGTLLQKHSEILQKQGKTLKYLKTKVNRMNKTLDIVAIRYDERISKNEQDIDRIKEQVRLPLTH